jgi:hypothetical protein
MTRAGLDKIRAQLEEEFIPAQDIIAALKKDAATWKNFRAFPESIPSHSSRLAPGPALSARNFSNSLALFYEDDGTK